MYNETCSRIKLQLIQLYLQSVHCTIVDRVSKSSRSPVPKLSRLSIVESTRLEVGPYSNAVVACEIKLF